MDKEEIIKRLKKLSGHAVQVAGEPPYPIYVMSLDDGIALNEAIRLLKEQEAIIEQYHRADGFLAAHGWKW